MGKVYRIGLLGDWNPRRTTTYWDAFRASLREGGWREGENVVIEAAIAEGNAERRPELAARLVRLNVDVIAVTIVFVRSLVALGLVG